MSISYLRRGLVSWNLSCKLPLHFTNLWQTDSSHLCRKCCVIENDRSVWRPLVRPVVPWSSHFGPASKVRKKETFQAPTDLNSCIFSVGIILSSKPKWDFRVKSYSLVSWRIIHFCSIVFRAVTMWRKRNLHCIKWIQSKFGEEKKFFVACLRPPQKTSHQGPVLWKHVKGRLALIQD